MLKLECIRNIFTLYSLYSGGVVVWIYSHQFEPQSHWMYSTGNIVLEYIFVLGIYSISPKYLNELLNIYSNMKMNTFEYNNTTILRIQNYCIRIYIQFLNTIMEYNITTCMKFEHGCKLRKQILQGLYFVLDVSA